MRTDVVIYPSLALPWGAEMVCFTILGGHEDLGTGTILDGHDALNSDK